MSKVSARDLVGAKKDSAKAKTWTWASVIVALAGWCIYGFIFLIAGIMDLGD